MAGADAERRVERPHNHEDAVVERRLRALYHPPEPDPAFVTRLEEDLLVRPVAVPMAGLAWSTTPNGRVVPSPAHSVSSPLPGPNRGRHLRALALFATAALLVVTLGLSFAAFGSLRLRPWHPTTFLAAVVQEGTPEGTSETRFTVAFPAPVLPAGSVYAWSNLYAVEPGVSTAYPGFKIESPVAALVWVQSGTMAIDGEHIAVHRAAAEAPDASPVPGELLLGAGDAVGLELGPGHSYQLRSVGPEPLVFAEFWMVGGPRPNYTYPPEYEILSYHNLLNATTFTSPATVTMQLTQSVVPPEETLAPPEGSWQLALQLPLTDRRSGANVVRQIPSGALKNMSQTPITVVSMTAEFQEAAATPTAGTPTG